MTNQQHQLEYEAAEVLGLDSRSSSIPHLDSYATKQWPSWLVILVVLVEVFILVSATSAVRLI